MSTVIKEGKTGHRPSWNYQNNSGANQQSQQLEMLESARNVLEQIRNSQMLQCDVAGAIRESARELRRCRITLEKIARRRRGNQSKSRRKT
jgi:hypothetical protein